MEHIISPSITQSAKDFFTWWGEGLVLLMPGDKNKNIGRNKESLLLTIERDECQLYNQEEESLFHHEQAIADLDTEHLGEIFQRNQSKEGTALNIQINSTEVLTRQVSLPASTEENLYAVIQYEMDRYTPFKKEDVYFDYRIEERDKERQTIKVLLIVVRKEILDSVISSMQSSHVHLRNIDIVNTHNPEQTLNNVNLLREHSDIGKSKKLSNKWLLATALGLLLLTGLTPIVMNYFQIHKLNSELKSLEGTVTKVKQLQNEYTKMQDQVGYLINIKDKNPSIVEMLDLLTKVIPDHTYVQRFSFEGGLLSIQGLSASASDLIAIIDQTGLFNDIRFAAPVTQSGENNLERYSISAHIKTKTVKKQIQHRLTQYQTISSKTKGLSNKLAKLEAFNEDQEYYFEEGKAALVSAELQGILKDVLNKHDVKIISTQPVTSGNLDERQIKISVHCRADINALRDMIYELESYIPVLMLDKINISRGYRATFRQQKSTNQNEALDVRFDVSGFLASRQQS